MSGLVRQSWDLEDKYRSYFVIFVIWAVNLLIQLLTLIVIVKVFLAYFVAPYHPVRLIIDRIVEPLLRPIRKIVPSIGMVDLSPIILIIAVQLLGRIIVNLLLSIS